MAMREILRKLMNGNHQKEFGENDGLTPDEVELEWYRRKEYLKKVKEELKRYREKERNSLWKGNKMNDNHQIIKAKNVFKGTKMVFKNGKRR